ncbi:MAG: nuclear transport factor 2 family protein [Terracidiphilus sp.]
MRKFLCSCVLICAIGCPAQSPETQVLVVYKQLEKAVQTGDANHTFVGLWSREKAPEAEKMRAQIPPQPNVHYTASKVFVQGDQAVLLGQYAQDAFLSLRFIKEDGRWKIQDLASSDKPYHPPPPCMP